MKIFTAAILGMLAMSASGAYAQVEENELLSNAQDHTSLIASNSSSGRDENGFYIAGNGARLYVNGDIQFRYTYNPSRNNPSVGNNAEAGFTLPLTKLRFSGNINESVDFEIEGDFDNDSSSFELSKAYAGLSVFDNGRVQLGQFRLPFMREQNISDRFQLAVGRSVMSYVFGQGYSQGVQLSYDLGDIRFIGAVSDGFNSANTDFADAEESDLALTARVEYFAIGNSNSFRDFTSERDQDNSLMFGAAFHYQDGDTQDSMYTYTGDVSWEMRGWNVSASGVGRHMDSTAGDFDDFGFAIQGGYRLTEQVEPFVRYDVVLADSDRGFSNDNFNFVTAGMNYYVHGHAAKFTVDVVWAMDETQDLSSMYDFSNTGLLGSSDGDELAFRGQFQLLF